MAFIFAKKGTVIVTGNMEQIQEHTDGWPLCHGICHYYVQHGVIKRWMLFGHNPSVHTENRGPRSRYQFYGPVAPKDRKRGWYRDYMKGDKRSHRRDTFFLYDYALKKRIRTWRTLPSRYMDIFDAA